MARFYGIVRGQAKTRATRRGSPSSGLVTECNGWNVGVRCEANVAGDRDVISVYATTGSNSSGEPEFVLRVYVEDGAIVIDSAWGRVVPEHA